MYLKGGEIVLNDAEKEKRAKEILDRMGVSYDELIEHLTTEFLKYIASNQEGKG